MIKVVKTEKQYSCDKYNRYTDENNTLIIEKSYDAPWAQWEVRLPRNISNSFREEVIVRGKNLSDIKKYLSEFNSVATLVGTWYMNNRYILTI